MGCRIVKRRGTRQVRKKVTGEPLAENQALDSWMWILRARAAARQAVEGAELPPAPAAENDAERQVSPPE
jgi:hypothetical protein